ncbi:MAG: tRNA (adenosine(37)-N6)-dimethylallyltransferase MiaA [Nitrospirae bacterium]|nr:tRNA (adenosine(37)-N6)-dimethylallyltransferase MiaA [Nitrospirota bacterium]MBF0590774.1 tRNA (adenosine(37)-N6)-dimethylallyltransferase MiaA [Nitrospirota bacterium]
MLVGPTCVGKSGVAMLMAQYLDSEIVSADSMQVYRGMDIGTAKPSEQQQRQIRHHMIDVAEPWEEYSTGRYLTEAVGIINSLHERGRIPLVVGGTGLYLRAMTRGLVHAPQADWQLRDRLMTIEARRPGWLRRYLGSVDPKAYQRVDPHDTRRIVRCVEVFVKSGRPISELHASDTRPLPHRFIKIGLTRNRQELYSMIERRVEHMIACGLIQEVKALSHLELARTALQAIGYKEVLTYLRGETGLEMAVEDIKKATKRYAKRQFTWFKTEDNITWVDASGMYNPQDIFEKIKPILNKYRK